MQIPNEVMAHLAEPKSEWLETQFRTRLEFAIQSRDSLIAEAHTTLNWLFAVIVFPAGFALNQIASNTVGLQLYVASCASISGSLAAVFLFIKCLTGDYMIGLGNCPSSLLSDSFCKLDLHVMRVAEAANYEERIAEVGRICARMGTAILIARWSVVLIPLFSFVTGCVIFYFSGR